MVNWNSLPLELREVILEMFVDSIRICVTEPRRRLSEYVSVCTEWQNLLESSTFRRLTLNQSDIAEFDRILTSRRRRLVEWIWFRLTLPTYDCDSCGRAETSKEITANNVTFTNAYWDLSEVLSSWEDEGLHRNGLTLELSAHSPSDSEHFFKQFGARMNDNGWDDVVPALRLPSHDPEHFWDAAGQQTHRPSGEAELRAFGPLEGLKFNLNAVSAKRQHRRLPEIIAVKTLIIRRQFYRAFATTKTLGPIFQSFTGLKNFIYEPRWGERRCDGFTSTGIREGLLNRVLIRASPSLTRVSLFDHDQIGSEIDEAGPFAEPLGFELARASRLYEELYVSHNCDAKYFFHTFWQRPEDPIEWLFLASPGDLPFISHIRKEYANDRQKWPSLKHLCLSSYALNPEKWAWMAEVAAKAAHEMPQLEIMELWSINQKHSCIFRYERGAEETAPKITLMSSWGGTIGKTVLKSWTNVAHQHRPRKDYEMQAQSALLNRPENVSDLCYMDVVSHLVLKDRLLNKTSLQQMEREDVVG